MSDTVVFSRRQVERFTPPGSPRAYLLQPLAFRARQAYRTELQKEGGIYPTEAAMIEGLKGALTEIGPDNLAELLAEIDAAIAEAKAAAAAAGTGGEGEGEGEAPIDAPPPDNTLRRKLTTLEVIGSSVPSYAVMVAARNNHLGWLPLIAARHALRGWEGPQLPPFRAERGLVSFDLLELLPIEELEAVGWRAAALMSPAPAAAGNSEGRSPPPAIQQPIAAE